MGIKDDNYWMSQALKLAQNAKNAGEVPVGAVLLNEEGDLVAGAGNAMIKRHDPSAHAEILVLREAAALVKNYRLTDYTLYVSLEPCPMCAAALVHARIKRLVFAVRDYKTGAAGTVMNLVNHPKLNHRISVDEGLMADASEALLSDFFKARRDQ